MIRKDTISLKETINSLISLKFKANRKNNVKEIISLRETRMTNMHIVPSQSP
jgi:hypothetical protein